MKKSKPSPLISIKPKTENQTKVFEQYRDGWNLVLSGCAGTGKTFLMCYLALRDVLLFKTQGRIRIIRSVVPTRDIGHLPGDLTEKLSAYMSPYIGIFNTIKNVRENALLDLMKQNLVIFESTSYLRGCTFSNEIVIVDEYQNMSFHELDSIITRCGINTRIFFIGDEHQSDLKRSDYLKFIKLVTRLKSFQHIKFTTDDIVRSELVKEYLTKKYLLTE